MGSKKGYIEREEFFYYEIHMTCGDWSIIHYSYHFWKFQVHTGNVYKIRPDSSPVCPCSYSRLEMLTQESLRKLMTDRYC